MVFSSHCIEETVEALSGVAPGVLDDSMGEVEAGVNRAWVYSLC